MKKMPVYIPHAPAFQLLVSLVLGILLADYLFAHHIQVPSGFFLWGTGCGFCIALIVRLIKTSYAHRWIFGFFSLITIAIFGCGLTTLHLQRTEIEPSGKIEIYYASVTDRPEVKSNSTVCKARLKGIGDSLKVNAVPPRDILLYFRKDSAVAIPERGDEIVFSARLHLPEINGNPDEFDYPRFLRRKGIAATAFVGDGCWRAIGHDSAFTIGGYASDCRDRLIIQFQRWGFEGDELGVLSALTVGYQNELSDSIRESFSVSGVSHVLALSGLHIAFLYSLLMLVTGFLLPGNLPVIRVGRSLVVIILLWFFAIFTGCSPSVVRAVIMCTMWCFARLFIGRTASLNILCSTAFFMLVYNPGWWFDVGFQLSFAAVAAILIFNPWFQSLLTFKHWLPKQIWSLISLSIVAQVGTVPLVLFYFSRYPVYFLLANLFIIPLSTIILYGAVMMCVFFFVPPLAEWVAFALNLLLKLFNGIVRFVERLPFASIDGIYLYYFEVICLYLLIVFLFQYAGYKRFKDLKHLLILIGVMLLFKITMMLYEPNHPRIAFYNVRQCPAVHCIAGDGRSWIAYADSVPRVQALKRAVSRYWTRLHLDEPQTVTGDYSDRVFMRRDCLLNFDDKRIAIVNDNRWRWKNAKHPLRVDYLYLCKGYSGTLSQLLTNFSTQHVILDASLPAYRIDDLVNECTLEHLPYVVLSAEGAYIIEQDKRIFRITKRITS